MSITRAVEAMRRGELVAFPTETVYGLGADATSSAAVQRLFQVKGRPRAHPVIAHVATFEHVAALALDLPSWAEALAGACWPGPLTLVVSRRANSVCDEVTGGLATVGVRIPAHPLALELLEAFGRPVAAPSANRFGRVSPTTAQHVIDDLGDDVAVVLDGGACTVGVESTIVDATSAHPVVLRLGAVTVEMIERLTGVVPRLKTRGEVAAPGTLASHYAPRCAVEIVTSDTAASRARAHIRSGRSVGLLALADVSVEVDRDVVRVASPPSVAAFAEQLYGAFRSADASGLAVLLVVPPDDSGIGAAVLDRLQRAATVSS